MFLHNSIVPTTVAVSCYASASGEVLQRKIRSLENENISLKTKIENLSSTADDLDKQEAHLVNDCVQELTEANAQLSQVHEELGSKSEVIMNQQHKIEQLMTKIATLEKQLAEV